MNAFNELREQARKKRDAALHLAREEYNATLVRITILEQDILGKEASDHRSIASCINSVIPKDRPFTTDDILIGLEALDSKRDWRKRSIDCHLSYLREKGIVKRLKRHRGRELAEYAMADAVVNPSPFGDKTLVEVLQQIMATRHPMRPVELTVALLEAGYHTTMSRDNLRNHISIKLRENPELFKFAGGKWMLVG